MARSIGSAGRGSTQGAVFAALLGDHDNGHWSIAADNRETQTRRRYLPGTLILETEIETQTGIARLTEFMPLRRESGNSHLVRLLQGLDGTAEMTTELVMRFDYGSIVPWVTRHNDRLHAVAGPDLIVVQCGVPLQRAGLRHRAKFTISAGQTIAFVIGYGRSYGDVPAPLDPLRALEETKAAWERWSADGQGERALLGGDPSLARHVKGAYLSSRPGASSRHRPRLCPNFSAASAIGITAICWLRDATFTLCALINPGIARKPPNGASGFARGGGQSPRQVQIMYGLAGERRLDEMGGAVACGL